MRSGRDCRLFYAPHSNGFRLIREKGSVRYYRKPELDKVIRVDYHASKEVPTGTCHAILKAAGLKAGETHD
ncbi:MAG: type II toxin-antitoxin system HicA family toxin [Candidatus Methylomirabilota bacterium]